VNQENEEVLALKSCQKSTVIKQQQVDYLNNEKRILEQTNFPFIVELKGTL
jgi:serine/threonine protein kinase